MLTEELALLAADAVRAIDAGLVGARLAEIPVFEHGIDLGTGAAGRELFHCRTPLRARSQEGEVARRRLQTWLETAGEQPVLPSGLFTGLTGVLWVGQLIRRLAIGGSRDAPAWSLIDALVADNETLLLDMLTSEGECDIELIAGLCGLGVYCLARLPSAFGNAGVAYIVSRLSSSGHWTRDGVHWDGDGLTLEGGRRFPAGVCNLGMAHGMGGVIAFLARVVRECPSEEAERLLEASVAFVLACTVKYGRGIDVPGAVAANSSTIGPDFILRTQPAWCYGSLGVACALSSAAEAIGHAAWKVNAEQLLLAQARRLSDATMMSGCDMGICHGYAGIGHLFRRAFLRTGDPVLRSAALTSYERLLQSWNQAAIAEAGGGFRVRLRADGEPIWVVSTCFLTGAAGIGLVLSTALGDNEVEWDTALLI